MRAQSFSAPEGWGETRLDRVASVSARIGWKALTADEYVPDGYVFLSTPNIKAGAIDFDNVNYIPAFRYDESPDLKLAPGDVLLVKDGNTLGITNMVRALPRPATVNGSIAVIRTSRMVPGFLRYVLASDFLQGRIAAYRAGMGVPHLFQSDIKKFPLPEPSVAQQLAITRYLDTATANLDEVLRVRRRTLAVLEQRKRAIIDSLATGLTSRPRDSPVWRPTRVKFLTQRIEQGWSPQCDLRPAENHEWGVLKAGCVNGGVFQADENKALPADVQPVTANEVRAGDLLMSRANTRELVASVCIVPEVRPRLLLCDKLYRIVPNRRTDPEFLALGVVYVRNAKADRGRGDGCE